MAKTEQAVAAKELEKLRVGLLEQRQEILDLYKQDVRAGQEAADEGADDLVDRANNSYSREFLFTLSDNERGILIQLEAALERIEEGTYGLCTNCGREIGIKRLEAVPWARFCIDCQELAEQGMLDETEG